MNLIQKLKCSFKSAAGMTAYYRNLSSEKLKHKRRTLKSNYIAISISWLTSLLVIAVTTISETPELLIMFAGAVVSILLLTHRDYKTQKSLINKALRDKI